MMMKLSTILSSFVSGGIITAVAFMLAGYDRFAQHAHLFHLIGRGLLLLPLYPMLIIGRIFGVHIENTAFGQMITRSPYLAIWDSIAYAAVILLVVFSVQKIFKTRTGKG